MPWPRQASPRYSPVTQCPYLVELSDLVESLVSSGMYTKFSEALSIKYPEELNTLYPPLVSEMSV